MVLVDDIIPKTGGNCSFICKKAVTLENIKVYLVIVVRKLTLPDYMRRGKYETIKQSNEINKHCGSRAGVSKCKQRLHLAFSSTRNPRSSFKVTKVQVK